MATLQEKPWNEVLLMMARFDVVMLVTIGRDRSLHARPMYVADHAVDGSLVFISSDDTAKIEELAHDERAVVTMQSRTQYVALTGRAVASRSADRARLVWKRRWEAWFPNGPDDPRLTIIDFVPERVEFWDLGRAGIRRIAGEHGQAQLRYFAEEP